MAGSTIFESQTFTANGFQLGSETLTDVTADDSNFLSFVMSGIWSNGDAATGGPVLVTLINGRTWAAVGATGTAAPFVASTAGTGAWQMVAPSAAPIPAPLALMAPALFGILAQRRRRAAAAQAD